MIITNDFELARILIDEKIKKMPLEDLDAEEHSLEIEIIGETESLISAIKKHDESGILEHIKVIESYMERRKFYSDIIRDRMIAEYKLKEHID